MSKRSCGRWWHRMVRCHRFGINRMAARGDHVWRRLTAADAPTARRYACGGMYNGRLYVFGGINIQKESLNDFHSFDVEKKLWQVVAQNGEVPSVRHGASAVVYKDRLYVFGGASAKNKALDDMYSFEFATGQWSRITSPGGPSKRYFAATVVASDRLFVHGGEVNIKTQVADFYEFTFTDSKWRKIEVGGALTVKERAGHILFGNSDYSKLYLYGGYTGDGGYEALNDLYFTDIDKFAAWEKLDAVGQVPRTGRPLDAIRIAYGKTNLLFVFGGYDNDTKMPLHELRSTDLFTGGESLSGIWREISMWCDIGDDMAAVAKGSKGTVPTPRYGHVWGYDPKHQFIIFGGSGSMYLNDVVQIELEQPKD